MARAEQAIFDKEEPEVLSGGDADLARHQSATDLVRIWEEQSERIRRAFAEILAAEQTLGEYFSRDPRDGGNSSFDVRICQRSVYFDDPDRALKKLRHQVWDRVIDQLGVRQMLSVRAARELDQQIEREMMPEITRESVRDLAESFRGQLEELHAEAVREVFEFLRPRNYTRLKTNKKNDWILGEKVILEGWLEDPKWHGRGYHLNYHHWSSATALENVFRALDGKGQILKTYHSELQTAIADSSDSEPRGVGSTDYFEFKCFRNRNLHLRFKRPDLVRRLNQIAGGKRLKGEKR